MRMTRMGGSLMETAVPKYSPEEWGPGHRGFPRTRISNSQLEPPLHHPTLPPEFYHRSNGSSIRLGKVAVIRDIAAVTYVKAVVDRSSYLTCGSLEAMIFFLYTGKIMFAPLSSDQRYEVPAEERVGDWNMGRVPYASAKSIYRLADKVTDLTNVRRPLAHQLPV